jgi:hypothetical protein
VSNKERVDAIMEGIEGKRLTYRRISESSALPGLLLFRWLALLDNKSLSSLWGLCGIFTKRSMMRRVSSNV